MKKIYSKSLLGALLLGGISFSASAADFPDAKLVNPLMGLSTFNTVTVVWDYVDLQEGPAENRLVSITTPSGEEYSNTAFTEYVKENDEGGSMDSSNSSGENALTVTFYKILVNAGIETGGFSEEGIYTISVPEGAVSIDGVPNPAVELKYNLGYLAEMEDATCEFSVENDQAALLISWDGQKVEKTRAASGGFGGYLNGDDIEEETELFGGSFSLIEDNTILKVNLSGYVNEGNTYTLTFPGGQVQNEDEEVNPTQTFEFTYSEDAGIEIINAEGLNTVYGINGVKVSEGIGNNTLHNLAPGIYIVNGKKVLVK